MFVYKIFLPEQWTRFQASGIFRGAPIDLKDGFLHFSSATQVEETANLHFADQETIVVARVSTEAMKEGLIWETSRRGSKFPHLYRELGLDEVAAHWEITRENGRFTIES